MSKFIKSNSIKKSPRDSKNIKTSLKKTPGAKTSLKKTPANKKPAKNKAKNKIISTKIKSIKLEEKKDNSNIESIETGIALIKDVYSKICNMAISTAKIFMTPTLINKTDYFTEILNGLDKSNIYAYNSYVGNEYIILVYPAHHKIYYVNEFDCYSTDIKVSGGISMMSAIKTNDTYYIRNVIIHNDAPLHNKDSNAINKIIKDSDAINKINKEMSILINSRYMTYYQITKSNYKTVLTALHSNIKSNTDTIEFVKQNNKLYKWTSSDIPIIFYAKQNNSPGIKTAEKSYILFLSINTSDISNIGITASEYSKLFSQSNKDTSRHSKTYIQFSPCTFPNAYLFHSDKDVDSCYVRLIFNFSKKEWSMLDYNTIMHEYQAAALSPIYTYGQDYKTVELGIWNYYRNPCTFNDLIIDYNKIDDQMYFVNIKKPIHEAPIKFNNFVKNKCIMNNINTSHDVIDLASGRGSDLYTYKSIGFRNLLFCEMDSDAIDVCVERNYSIPNKNTHLKIMNADLNTGYLDTVNNINKYYMKSAADNIFCFFALHYLTDTVIKIKNIAGLINSLLKPGGKFLYTAFDENKVIKLLSEHKGKWEVQEKGVKKYSIVSKYEDADISTATRLIKLILPFNSETKYYDENLINENLLDKELKKHNIILESEGNFLDYANEFKTKKYNFYNRLTPQDNIFIGLYKYRLFAKKK